VTDDRKIQELRRLHPAPSFGDSVTHLPVTNPVLEFSAEEFVHQAARLCRGRAPGASGWTEELLTAAARNDNQAAQLLANVVVDIMNDDSPEVNREISLCRLCGIPKPDKPGEVRPLGLGEPLMKIAAATALKKCGAAIDAVFGEKQFVMRDGGAEQIIHMVRSSIRSGKIVVALDSANAFNTIEREAIVEALKKYPATEQIHGVFNSTYNRPSRLRVFTRDGFTDIESRRGVRQGDPLGSVLYAVGSFPCIETASLRHTSCKIVSFADDIFIITDSVTEGEACTETIGEELRKIGVSLNRRKTRIMGQEGCERGMAILGAWCGYEGSAEDFLTKKLEKFKTFFDGLDGLIVIDGEPVVLPADVRFAALSQAGHARWTFVARTHPPEEDVMNAHRRFDDIAARSLCSAAAVTTELPQHAKLIAQLPISEGGLGLPSFSSIAPIAYGCSSGAINTDQHTGTLLFNQALIDALSHEIREHLAKHKHKLASLWLRKFGALDE
jgi:hypothetical protein